LQLDLVAEAFQAADETAVDLLTVAFVEVTGAEVDVLAIVVQEVPDDAEDAVGDGDDGLVLTAARGQVLILAGEIGVLGVTGGMRGFGERGAEPHIAFAGLAGLAALTLASALVVAGTEAGPGCQVGGARKTKDVSPDLGEQDLDRALANPSDGVQADDLV